MISPKIILCLLPLGIVLLLSTIYYSLDNSQHTDNAGESSLEFQISKHRRTIRSNIHYCKLNQYYDNEEGRCLGVPGGGKMLHVHSGQTCGVNILKPHCTNSLYYYICKRDKAVLAQCANRKLFNNRLQRCVYYNLRKFNPDIIQTRYGYHDQVQIPFCTRPGRFPVPDRCSMFYVCDTNGHRFFQSVFKCPQNMGYQEDKGTCATVTNCKNDNSVESTICVPDVSNKNIEFLNANKATEENNEKIFEVPEESKILSRNDPDVKIIDEPEPENEDNGNLKIDDNPLDIIPFDPNPSPLSANIYEGDKVPITDTQPLPNPPLYVPENKIDEPSVLSELSTVSDTTILPQQPLIPSDEPSSIGQESFIISDKQDETTTQDTTRLHVDPLVTSDVLIDPSRSYIENSDLVPSTNDASRLDSTAETILETLETEPGGATNPIENIPEAWDKAQNDNKPLPPLGCCTESALTAGFDDAPHSITAPLTSRISEIEHTADANTNSNIDVDELSEVNPSANDREITDTDSRVPYEIESAPTQSSFEPVDDLGLQLTATHSPILEMVSTTIKPMIQDLAEVSNPLTQNGMDNTEISPSLTEENAPVIDGSTPL